jgi:hypothetical protein
MIPGKSQEKMYGSVSLVPLTVTHRPREGRRWPGKGTGGKGRKKRGGKEKRKTPQGDSSSYYCTAGSQGFNLPVSIVLRITPKTRRPANEKIHIFTKTAPYYQQ